MKNDPHSCECDLCKLEKVLKFFQASYAIA